MGKIVLKRISKAEWLSTALETLEVEGINGVNIEKLARKLGIAKSGFYWHFKNRAELLEQMLEYWTHEFTEVVIGNIDSMQGPANKRLASVMHMISRFELNKLDAAIYLWAKSDPKAHKALDRVFKMRLDYLRKLFRELGFKGEELEMRTRLFVVYHSFEYLFFENEPKAKQERLLKLRARLLMQK